MRTFRLERSQLISRPIEEVFAFFSDPANLQRITPPWLRLRMLSSSTPAIEEGTTLDYRLRLRGIPLRWTSRIRAWDPPLGFVDEQARGPYRRWVHTHRFEPREGGTLVRDQVEYAVHGGALVQRLLVGPDLERIFDYRQARLLELLPA